MGLTIVMRRAGALVVALTVVHLATRGIADGSAGPQGGRSVDLMLEVLVVWLVTARLGWVALEGWPSVLRAPSTLILVLSGVETWVGVAAATGWAR